MKKNVWTFGVIAGFISTIGFVIGTINPDTIDMEKGMIYGFASMILAFSLTFVAIKNYRDKYNGGAVSFKKAFLIGLYISLIASSIYVAVWLVEYYFILDNFWGKYAEMHQANLVAEGLSQEKIATEMATIDGYKELYDNNPLLAGLITYTEILPLGIVISLIAAAILKRKPQTPQIA
ncbi:DUF4199 domain-containing protein [Flavobacterium salilacus subsp. salilacus]|uniref:DUF4199 domain-containing protein n=1 Tax=Flavobacterium TaxID=237 RepID=UPI0010753513|nr:MULTISPECIES: DUF4199 domain-containing protein [Flavobacterium]KAF2519099.1 DUF4199 domain-containing protein [Flavobacterium salilacus subsp. salilacus]MBE1613277.1 DUF4199 domain-containing protein [Flavobacterium sp. SaA2.13]NDI98993.1 DUF4199 domain-containing protein [Flavobacterium salilacus subsp. altitudinum]